MYRRSLPASRQRPGKGLVIAIESLGSERGVGTTDERRSPVLQLVYDRIVSQRVSGLGPLKLDFYCSCGRGSDGGVISLAPHPH